MHKFISSTEIRIKNIPIQWIPKIEIYYPDLPQFPIMYIHTYFNDKRLIVCPVSVGYEIDGDTCVGVFTVLCNLEITKEIELAIKGQLENRIGFTNKIAIEDVISACRGNIAYENILKDVWEYIELSYGKNIPFAKFYEEIYSIVRFVSAWQPKTGRQSEMRMLYNFMSGFGEEVEFPQQWKHLEYYIIPNYQDALTGNFEGFEKFQHLYSGMGKLYTHYFTNEYVVDDVTFKVMPRAWERNKNDFIEYVSKPLYVAGILSKEERFYTEKLVDAFNRHAWRAAFFISAFMNIYNKDYYTWSKSFFKEFYDNGAKLKGYSEKVIACFLQQGFAKEDIIPVDTWIETFYKYPLGIATRSEFYNSFDSLGKLERVIWLASQSNKTNMKNFFNILWCQRYGVIGNGTLRGINPIACISCRIHSNCVGATQYATKKLLLKNASGIEGITVSEEIDFVCLLEEGVPKKAYLNNSNSLVLVDEFSGYHITKKISDTLISQETVSFKDFIND